MLCIHDEVRYRLTFLIAIVGLIVVMGAGILPRIHPWLRVSHVDVLVFLRWIFETLWGSRCAGGAGDFP